MRAKSLTENNIALVGFMGTGKTTVGRLLAKKCNLTFIDIDECIVEKAGMSIPLIFSRYGENYFRDMEEEVLRNKLSNMNQIISCGGGVVTRKSNRQMLKNRAITCCLYNSLETSLRRINQESRPLLNSPDPAEKALKLFKEREALYLEIAQFRIDTESLNQSQIADIIHENIYTPFFCKR